MYVLAEMDRVAVDNSGYVPNRGDFVQPWQIALSTYSDLTGNEPVPVIVAHEYAPTTSGRAARGELESEVMVICTEWLIDEETRPCTPVYISGEIGHKYGIKAPSVGAIDAVFKRWVKIGYATVVSKPTRFTEFTADGILHGLQGCKARYKRRVRV